MVLGACLNLLSGVRVGFPTLPNAFLIGLLVPGAVTLLLGWTLVDRWPTRELALVRDGRAVAAARVGLTVVVCLLAAVAAGAGHQGGAVGSTVGSNLAGTCWLLALALVLDVLVSGSGWLGAVVGQFLMLRVHQLHLSWTGFLDSPAWALPALAVGMVIAVSRR